MEAKVRLRRFSFIITLAIMGVFLFVIHPIVVTPNTASAQGVNCLVYDFEDGMMPPEFQVGGLAGHAEVLHGGLHVLPPIVFPAGDHFLLLSSGPGMVNEAVGPDLDGNMLPDSDTTIVSFDFDLNSSQVPAILGFYWSFFTGEYEEEPYDDFFMVTLNDSPVLSGSVPTIPTSPFPNVPPLDGTEYIIDSPGLTYGSEFEEGRCEFQAFSQYISNPGTYTLQFLVADQANHDVDSGLLIDYITVECNVAPSGPVIVGGEVVSESQAAILAPWVALGVIILSGSMYLIRRRVHS
ncbi:hypothetical protein ACFLXT_05275 [Chloroflexota bacterium]